MNAKLIFVILFTSSLSFASIKQSSINEILRLPYENAKLLINEKSEYYQDLKDIAFDSSEKMNLRWAAIQMMAFTKKNAAMNDLITLSSKKEWFLKSASLLAMNSLNNKIAIEHAKKLIQNKALVVRSTAVDILAQNPENLDREVFWQELEASYNYRRGQSLWIRPQIVKALAMYPLEREQIKFKDLVKDKDEKVRLFAHQALENIKNMYQ